MRKAASSAASAIVRPTSHDPAEHARSFTELVVEQSPGPSYFVRHLAQSTPVKGGWPKGLRYPVRR